MRSGESSEYDALHISPACVGRGEKWHFLSFSVSASQMYRSSASTVFFFWPTSATHRKFGILARESAPLPPDRRSSLHRGKSPSTTGYIFQSFSSSYGGDLGQRIHGSQRVVTLRTLYFMGNISGGSSRRNQKGEEIYTVRG